MNEVLPEIPISLVVGGVTARHPPKTTDIIEVAKRLGCFYDSRELLSDIGATFVGNGRRSEVFVDKKHKYVYKLTYWKNLGIGSPDEMITLHNMVFFDSRYELIGFANYILNCAISNHASLCGIIRQPYIKGLTLHKMCHCGKEGEKEKNSITDLVLTNKYGCQKSSEDLPCSYTAPGVMISDVHSFNVIVPDGKSIHNTKDLVVIDCNLRNHTWFYNRQIIESNRNFDYNVRKKKLCLDY